MSVWLLRAPVIPMDRFRPNLALRGLKAYDEDFISTISIGAADWPAFVKPCARCLIPAIDQTSGACGAKWPNEPLDTKVGCRANRGVAGGLTF